MLLSVRPLPSQSPQLHPRNRLPRRKEICQLSRRDAPLAPFELSWARNAQGRLDDFSVSNVSSAPMLGAKVKGIACIALALPIE